MSGIPIYLDSDSESNVSPVARTRVSLSSNHSPFVYDFLGPKVISIIDDYDLEWLYVGSQNERVSSRDSSFDALMFDYDIDKDHIVALMSLSSRVVGNPTYLALSAS